MNTCQKSLLHFSFFVLLIAVLVTPIKFVQATFEEDVQGYLKVYDNYRVAHEAYLSTRSQYLQFQTLSAKNDALAAVKTFLIARDDTLLSYASLLRSRNLDQGLGNILKDQETFITDHKSKVPALGSLDDAVSLSGDLEKQHVSLQILSRKIVATTVAAKIDNLKLRFTLMESQANNLIATLKSQNKDVTTLERWLLDAHNKRQLSEQKMQEVRATIDGLTATSVDAVSKNYNDIDTGLSEANQYLREGISFLKELSDAIKYGNY